MANVFDTMQDGECTVIEGVVDYSHFTKPYEGEELQKQIARDRSFGLRYIIDKPYTKLALKNARVLFHAQPTALDNYWQARLYTDEKRQADGRGYTINLTNKGSIPPKFAVFPNDENGNILWQEGFACEPEGELANGQPVRVIMRVFKAKMGNGCGIDMVASVGNPRYATGFNRAVNFGPEFNGMMIGTQVPEGFKAPVNHFANQPHAVQPAPVPQPASQPQYGNAPQNPYANPYGQAPMPNPQQAAQPMGQPQMNQFQAPYGNNPYSQPYGNPFGTAPAENNPAISVQKAMEALKGEEY